MFCAFDKTFKGERDMFKTSRRKLLKSILASFIALTSIRFIGVPKKVTLSVDKDGNAILHGADMFVDSQANAVVE